MNQLNEGNAWQLVIFSSNVSPLKNGSYLVAHTSLSSFPTNDVAALQLVLPSVVYLILLPVPIVFFVCFPVFFCSSVVNMEMGIDFTLFAAYSF